MAFPSLTNLGKSFIDNVIRDTVTPKVGSILKCDLITFEHSGIYVGKGQIIHRDGDGYIDLVSYDEFINRLGGFNTALSVYVSCSGKEPFGKKTYAERAKKFINDPNFSGYNLLSQNCHNFTYACITGEYDDEQGLQCFSFTNLENLLAKKVDNFNWRVWDISKSNDKNTAPRLGNF